MYILFTVCLHNTAHAHSHLTSVFALHIHEHRQPPVCLGCDKAEMSCPESFLPNTILQLPDRVH